VKQIVQNLKSGDLEVLDVPCPAAGTGQLLIQTRASLISAGTERSVVEFGQASYLDKARQNPERVKQVLERIRSDGLLPTLELVFAKLDEPMPLGYCNAGEVIQVGAGVTGYKVGDRVASNGRHAEMVCRPINLCAKVPEGVPDDQATFAVLGSIGLQGVRLVEPAIGERVAVFGLGLIGLVAVQLLVSSGAHVIGIDVDPARLKLAEQFGATTVNVAAGSDPVAAGMAFTRGVGIDAVLVTASAKNDSIIHQAAQMSRKRGRIVLVGVVNLDIQRADFYEKELKFQVSCSYGPGRYDAKYEEGGVDYPLPFVRWTEQRNMEAILELIAAGRLNVEPLITSRIPHSESVRAYDLLANDRSQLGIVLEYPRVAPQLEQVVRNSPSKNGHAALPAATGTGTGGAIAAPASTGKMVAGFIGAGTFCKIRLLPPLRKRGVRMVSIASATGVTAALAAHKFGIETSTTDYRQVLADPAINTVFITTQHDTHVRFATAALEAGKHVFLEKPAATTRAGLDELRAVAERHSSQQLLVGFNRRFSPHARTMRKLVAGRSQPLTLTCLVNAGYLPMTHWAQDPIKGGGRIIGEGCHFVDLLRYIVDRPIVAVTASMLGDAPGVESREDKMVINLEFADGSLGTIQYLANGHRSFCKERLEVFSEGRILALDNFRRLTGYGFANFKKQNLWSQDKGRDAELDDFVAAVTQGGPQLMPAAEIWNVTEATFAAVESAASGRRIELGS
jgi:predicted dehydrogenase